MDTYATDLHFFDFDRPQFGSEYHMVQGWLKWNGTGVCGKQVKVMVNDTEYLPSLTDVNGYFRLSLDLQPVNNQSTTYMITASFEDTSQEPLNCTAWAKTLDGQDYAVCTTVQYGYKPSTNYASVTVEPRATQITADEGTSVSQANETTTQSSAQVPPQKTPEEMQKEAEDNGALKIWHEFSWWPPWYRLHINATIGGNAWIHAAFNPVLPILGGEVQTFGFENIVPPLPSTTTPPNLPPPPNTNVSDELTSLVLKEFFAFSFPMAAAIAHCKYPSDTRSNSGDGSLRWIRVSGNIRCISHIFFE
jgi:hypothetical protein